MKLEAARISNKIRKPIVDFAGKTAGSEPYVFEMNKNADGKCVFLRDNSCSIYRMRPLICAFYPFELRANRTNGHVFSYTDECPCIGNGPKLKVEYFERLFAKSKALMRRTRNSAT